MPDRLPATLAFIHLTRAAAVAELILLAFVFFMLAMAAIGMWLEGHAPIRDEDEELRRLTL